MHTKQIQNNLKILFLEFNKNNKKMKVSKGTIYNGMKKIKLRKKEVQERHTRKAIK